MNAVQRMIQPDAAGPALATIGAALMGVGAAQPQVFTRTSGSIPGSMAAAHQPADRRTAPWSMLRLGLKHAASWHGLFFFVHGRLFSSLTSLVQPRVLLP